MTFAAPTQVWHANAECTGRTLPALKDFDEFIEASAYNVLGTVDSPPAPACPFCGPRPLTSHLLHPLAAPLFVAGSPSVNATRPPTPFNRAQQPSPPPVARAAPPSRATASAPLARAVLPATTAATSTLSAPSAHLPMPVQAPAPTPAPTPAPANAPSPGATNAPVPVPTKANAAPPAHSSGCGCTAPKLGAVIDSNELLPGDVLRYSNGARACYMRKQGADAYIFNKANGEELGGTHQGPKSIANALASGSRVAKNVWAEFEVFRGAVLLGTLFEVRHAAYAAGRL